MDKGGELRVVAIMRDRDSAAALSEVCDGISRIHLVPHYGSLAQALQDSAAQPSPDTVLLEIDPEEPESIRHAVSTLSEAFPGVPVIATAAGAKMEHTRLLMRLGVVDLIPQPIEHHELLSVLDDVRRRARRANTPRRPPSRVAAFLKAGGGCGATTLASQTAAALAMRRGQAESGVCLLDLDMQFGTAALSIDLDDRVSLADLLEARERIDGALLRSVMGHHESGLDVLAAPRTLLPLDALSTDFAGDCLALARAEYRTVVLDLPSAWTAWTFAALKQCDLIVLVAQLSVSSLHCARRQLQGLHEHGLGGTPLRLVLNRRDRSWGAASRRREAEQALGRRFDFSVADDERRMRDALNRGVPVAKLARRSRVNRDLERLADGMALALAGGSEVPAAPLKVGGRIAVGEGA